MKAVVAWLHPRWGQMLCFWTAGIMLATLVSQRALEAVWFVTNVDFMSHPPTVFRVAVALLICGLALKAIRTFKPS